MSGYHHYYPPHHPPPHNFNGSQNNIPVNGGHRHPHNQPQSWNYPNQRNLPEPTINDYGDGRMTHGSNSSVYHHSLEEQDMMLDEPEYAGYQMPYPEEDEMVEGMMTPRAVHQCNICNKIFVSYKGLQQHAVIHTDQKPFRCDICSKSFRFKSNLFEHRSVHTGSTPHACPYCGKTCRLKGNLKKHLRTHVTTKEELEAAWRPFARFDIKQNGTIDTAKSRFSNRRPPADIPDDAIIVRGAGGPYYTPPPRMKKKKLGLGEPEQWVNKLRRGELLPQVELDDKLRRLEDTIFNNLSIDRWNSLFEVAKSIAFETHECPTCKVAFMTRLDCMSHHSIEHENSREGLDFFCEKCFRPFADDASYQQHMNYHDRVNNMLDNGSIDRHEPEFLLPTTDDISMLYDGSISQHMDQHM